MHEVSHHHVNEQLQNSALRDIDDDYNVKSTVSQEVFDQIMIEYRHRSEISTAHLDKISAVFDDRSGEALDIWATDQRTLRPAVISIHGGYWRALSRHDAAFMAAPLAAEGVATVTIDYSLAPSVTLEEIVRQVRTGVAWIRRHGPKVGIDPRQITAVGSSAGGHLVGCLMTQGWQARYGLPDDLLRAALPISGLFDLSPLPNSFANEWLHLDAQRARSLSPMFEPVPSHLRSVIAVAAHDGKGFVDQSLRFAEHVETQSPSQLLTIAGKNHYDVFLDLADPSSELFETLLSLVNP